MSCDYDFKKYILNNIPSVPNSVLYGYLDELRLKTDSFIREFKRKEESLKELCLKLSNYSDVLKGCLEIPSEYINRYNSIDWNSYYQKDGIWNTCSGRNPYLINRDLQQAAIRGDIDGFIGFLNEMLGNCCISSINELDD